MSGTLPSPTSLRLRAFNLSTPALPASTILRNVFLGLSNISFENFPTFFKNRAGSIIVSLTINLPAFVTVFFKLVLNPWVIVLVIAFFIELFATFTLALIPAFIPNFTPTLIPVFTAVNGAVAAPKVTTVATSVTTPNANEMARSWATVSHPAAAYAIDENRSHIVEMKGIHSITL